MDFLVILVSLALPWSTSLVAIFAVAWLAAIAPTLEVRALIATLKRPICAAPILLVVLAGVGALWSDAPWQTRLHAINPAVKLLALPLLIYHFERSKRGSWVFIAFLVSCTLLMAMSWLVAFYPALTLKPDGGEYGIPVKNYIDQSHEFAFCAVALAYPIVNLIRARRFALATLLGAIALGLLANMMFVTVSRTALVTMPIMAGVFALQHFRWRGLVIALCVTIGFAGAAWLTSSHLREKVSSFGSQYSQYRQSNETTSIGMRLEFWKKSLRFFAEAPVFGHGTGSTRGLFTQAAQGQIGAAAEVIGNPHNQTFNVAVQWGAVGVAILYAIWVLHLLLFQGSGLARWIGLLVVVQNMTSSLFNSHLFDFHEGWMYVLGVGVAGGMTLRERSRESAAKQAGEPALPRRFNWS